MMDRKRKSTISPPPLKRKRLSPPVAHASTAESPANNPSTMRLFTWNINGISPFLQQPITSYFKATVNSSPKDTTEQTSLRGFLARHNWPEIVFLQEVKINPTDTKTQDAVRRIANTPLPTETPSSSATSYEVHFTLPRDQHNARGFGGKVYGIASLIRSDFSSSQASRVRDVEWDVEGRVHVVELSTSRIAALNVYAVNGTMNPYRSPRTGAVVGSRHDRKLEFHRSLLEEALRLEKQGWHVVVAGDLNVARDARDGRPRLRTFPAQHCRNREDFNDKFFEGQGGMGAVDVWRELKGGERRYTYFPRGSEWGSSCDRVDLIISSRILCQKGRIKRTGILDSEEERGPSDHVPLWVEISLEDVGE
jgi:exonuclease III